VSNSDIGSWWAAHAGAREELTKIPGVIGVGLGIKEIAGQLSNDVALLVYVAKKKPIGSLPPTEVIPPSYRGMKTDVRRYPKFAELGSTTLYGGVQIRRLPDAQDRPKPGTLGYIATRTSDNVNVMLSCEHVMQFGRRDERTIFHPDVSRCCGKLKHKVGVAIDGRMGNVAFNNGTTTDDYFVDGAIASIDSGVTARKHIPNVGAITGSGDITASPTGPGQPTISVKKTGIGSAFTQGTVDDVAFPYQGAARTILIRPSGGGGYAFTIRWKVPPEDVAGHLTDFPAQSLGGTATAISADEVEFHVTVFALPGDSGSAVVDGTGAIVGMIFTGTVYELQAFQHGRLGTGIVPTGFGIACHMGSVLQQLGVRIDPGTATIAARPMLVPGDEIAPGELVSLPQLNARLLALETELERSPVGRQLVRFVRQNAEEVMYLVHDSRKVMVRWHRNHGPEWVALFMQAIADPDVELARVVKETTLEAARERMYEVLMQEGSAGLRAALTENRTLVCALMDRSRTVNDLLDKVRECEPDRATVDAP
jgi:hypothetical protein